MGGKVCQRRDRTNLLYREVQREREEAHFHFSLGLLAWGHRCSPWLGPGSICSYIFCIVLPFFISNIFPLIRQELFLSELFRTLSSMSLFWLFDCWVVNRFYLSFADYRLTVNLPLIQSLFIYLGFICWANLLTWIIFTLSSS